MAFKIKSFVGLFLFGIFMSVGSAYANISTVGYVHDTILSQKGITIPIDGGISRNQPHSVKYLMRQIDAANLALYEYTSTYANGASANLTDQSKVLSDINNFISPPPFKITTIPATTYFNFYMSAVGKWTVDWGDGYIETITKTDTTNKMYAHNYETAGQYVITMKGKATAYNPDIYTAAISFSYNSDIEYIDGSLGSVFQTVAGMNPSFFGTFETCSNMVSIPSDLFKGLTGAPIENMFYNTFYECIKLTGVPSGLFSSISGAPAKSMFANTFAYCNKLETIPAGLFSGISGAPATDMFYETFMNTKLTSIPAGLFSNINGAPAANMFSGTFSGCYDLIGSIPSGLFGNINGAPATGMFYAVFSGCYRLTGSIPFGLFGNLSGVPADSMFYSTFEGCSGLSGSIPSGLFGNLYGAPAANMFSSTFESCSGLSGSIPSGLFGNISGAPADNMFYNTFFGCSGLTSIPSGLFSGINGAPAYSMFQGTFSGCIGLKTVPSGLFGTFIGESRNSMFQETFSGCTGLTSIQNGIWDLSGVQDYDSGCFYNMFKGCLNIISGSPTLSSSDTTKLWIHFSGSGEEYAFAGCTAMSDYASIPVAWK